MTTPHSVTPSTPIDAAELVVGTPPQSKRIYFVETPEVTAKVLEMTKAMFQAEVEVSREFDPEGADEPDVIFRVTCRDGVDELVAKHHEWYRRVGAMSPGWNTYTLSAYSTE